MLVSPFAKVRKDDYVLSNPVEVFDQLRTTLCECCAVTSIGEDYFGIEFEPSYTYAKACQLQGQVMLNGLTMSMVCEAVRIFGLLPRSCSPYSIDTKPQTFLGDWKNWDSSLDRIAAQYKAKSYGPVIGLNTSFELIRATMTKGFPVLCGVYWQQEWDSLTKIDSNFQALKWTPHAIKAYGQKTIDGKPYIKILNSRGKNIGEDGSQYVSSDIKLKSPYTITF